ncbi:hypothetical protein B4147_1642 [Bacillus wiedmannii]|uniref:Uncharacterized protein n=1 Tax=Bacillus wiedmannii TaxID=1890302 RepID=A0A0G8BZR9_9BACI|nr:hypothetical protein B4147_1642 [Bacillus wiedmannii]
MYFSLDKKITNFLIGKEDIFLWKSQVYVEKNDWFIDTKVSLILKKYILVMRKI